MRERMGAIAPYLSVFGLMLLAGSMFVRQLPDMPEWATPALVAGGVVLLALWPILQPQFFRDLLGGRQARFGGNALLLTVGVIGVIGVINYLGTLRYARWDVTEGQRLSISSQTKQILDDIADGGEEINLTAVVARDGAEATDLRPLMEQYTERAPNIKFNVVDPQFDIAQLMAIQQRTGEAPPARGLLAELGGARLDEESGTLEGYRREVVYSFDEQAITEALVKLTRGEKRVIAFVTGHGEMSTVRDNEGRSLSAVAQELERVGYVLEEINLSTITETITADAVVVAGPQRAFTGEEQDALASYVESGGALMLLHDAQGEANFNELLAPVGVRINNDIVLDPQRSAQGVANLPVIDGDGYRFHETTRDLQQDGLNLIFFNASSIEVGESLLPSVTTTPLLETSAAAWGETGMAALAPDEQPSQDPGEASGPLTLAVAVDGAAGASTEEGAAPEGSYGRVMVLTGAEMSSDAFIERFQWPYNPIIVLNGVNWLTQDEALIGIPPTQADERPLEAPQNPWLLFLAVAVLMPAVVAGLGAWIFWTRR
jgi:ABC-type uncharacterized transport system involved in gliding motility auxiliary subunit